MSEEEHTAPTTSMWNLCPVHVGFSACPNTSERLRALHRACTCTHTHTRAHISLRNPSKSSHKNTVILTCLFSSPSNETIALLTSMPPDFISTKLSQNLPQIFFLPISQVSRGDSFHLFRLLGQILLSTTQSSFSALVRQKKHRTYHSEFLSLK